jgi:ComF family protein
LTRAVGATRPGDGIVGIAAPAVRLARAAVDLILPHRCALCGTILGPERGLCGACWAELRFVTPPWCSICGRPFDEDDAGIDPCGLCRSAPPTLRRTRAALAYDDRSRRLVIAFKHYGRLSLRPLFGLWLALPAGELLAEVDLIAPVPLHRRRLMQRGFNQAALLAASLEHPNGPRHVPDLLQRTRATASQQGLGARARRGNVTSSAFRVHPRARELVTGRRVLLVDDVLTTGATLEACARTLLRAGAEAVDALALARVTNTHGDPM